MAESISVIIPVGPGHEESVDRARLSVMAAQDSAQYAGDVRCLVVDDTQGELGRSKARNMAVESAKTDWVFFLDADDMMHPNAIQAWMNHEGHDAIWGTLREQTGQYLVERYEVAPITSYEQLIKYPPAWTVKIGHFIRADIARKYPFNEDMNCGEDWDYYLRVWKHENCIKIPEPFYVKIAGNHSTGPKSATGRDWTESVEGQLAEARKAFHEGGSAIVVDAY